MYQKIRNKKIFIAVYPDEPELGAMYCDQRELFCNLMVADVMRVELLRHGFYVRVAQVTNESDLLQEEIMECNSYKPELAIAVHTIMDGGSGFVMYYQTQGWENMQKSQQLAKCFHNKVVSFFPEGSKGIKAKSNLEWLQQVKAPAIICAQYLADDWYNPEQFRALGKVYAKAVLDFYAVPYRSDEVQTLRYSVVQEDQTRRDYSSPAVLIDGAWYIQLRGCAKNYGMGVFYEKESGRVLLYNTAYYTETEFEQRLICISDFQTREEAILSGLSAEEMADYQFEEYDRV